MEGGTREGGAEGRTREGGAEGGMREGGAEGGMREGGVEGGMREGGAKGGIRKQGGENMCQVNLLTLIFLPPTTTPFICSRASWAASAVSYSRKEYPLCFMEALSQDMLMDLMVPKGENACRTESSPSSKLMLPTYILCEDKEWGQR